MQFKLQKGTTSSKTLLSQLLLLLKPSSLSLKKKKKKMKQRLSETSSPSPLPSSSSSSSSPFSSLKEPVACSREAGEGEEQDSVTIEHQGNNHSALCKWKIHSFSSKLKTKALFSTSFEVGGFNWRFLVYPYGDSQSQSGYCSMYLQIITDKRKDYCFTSYRLSIVNLLDESKSVRKDSWYRFPSKKTSHGWCDFAISSMLVDPESGFVSKDDDYVVISADIIVLKEWVSFFRDNNEVQKPYTLSSSSVGSGPSELLSERFTWKVHNFSLFKEMIKTQKIMSPVFPAGECNLSISVYQNNVNGSEYLSMCLESKEKIYKTDIPDRSCWCLFRMSVMNQKSGLKHMHRDSFGRFATDSRGGKNTCLGWNDYMKMSDFIAPELGFLVDDTVEFSASVYVIKESSNFTNNEGLLEGRSIGGGQKSDVNIGKFTWRIDNFTRLKDLLKKKKLTGLCVMSKRFQIGGRDCCLIVYPRGQTSQPPYQLSLFLEVTDSQNTASDWSCFVSHRLSVVNQRMEDKSIVKESQNRYSKDAKDWGWRDFMTLSSLFDQHSGFLVEDSIVFSAEVLLLKETSEIHDFPDQNMELSNAGGQTEVVGAKRSFTWKVENFLSFKKIMETRKISSNFFQADGFELRIGVYVSFDIICTYLESDQSASMDPDKNFRVRYKMGVLNQTNSDKTLWKESSMFTNTWNKSVLQFMKMSDMLEEDAGFLLGDTIVFVCYIMDSCPCVEDLEIKHDAGTLAQLLYNSTDSTYMRRCFGSI